MQDPLRLCVFVQWPSLVFFQSPRLFKCHKKISRQQEEKSCSLLYFILMANAGEARHLPAAKNVRKQRRRSAEVAALKNEIWKLKGSEWLKRGYRGGKSLFSAWKKPTQNTGASDSSLFVTEWRLPLTSEKPPISNSSVSTLAALSWDIWPPSCDLTLTPGQLKDWWSLVCLSLPWDQTSH